LCGAISGAETTGSVVMRFPVAQPTTGRENASIAMAR
jgi:hypothetical protein